jgi:hypothetical protein
MFDALNPGLHGLFPPHEQVCDPSDRRDHTDEREEEDKSERPRRRMQQVRDELFHGLLPVNAPKRLLGDDVNTRPDVLNRRVTSPVELAE